MIEIIFNTNGTVNVETNLLSADVIMIRNHNMITVKIKEENCQPQAQYHYDCNRVTIKLFSIPLDSRIAIVKAIRRVTKLGLDQCIQLAQKGTQDSPSLIVCAANYVAEELLKEILEYGGKAELV